MRYILLISALVMVPVELSAQCYYRPSYQPSYQSYTPTYSNNYEYRKEYVPIAVPVSYPTVAVPIYSYVNAGYGVQPGYGYPAALPGLQSAYPNSAIPPGYGTPGYPGFTQGSYSSGLPTADLLADLALLKLQKQLGILPQQTNQQLQTQQLLNLLQQQQTPNQQQLPPNQQQQPPPSPGQQRNGNGPPAAVGAAPAPGNQAIKSAELLLTTKCASCHTDPAAAGGGFTMFNSQKQLVVLPRDVRWDCYDRIYDGTMPKNGPQLNDQETDLIRLWARRKN